MHILSNTAFSLSLIKLIGHSHLTADSPHGKKNPLPRSDTTNRTQHWNEVHWISQSIQAPLLFDHTQVGVREKGPCEPQKAMAPRTSL